MPQLSKKMDFFYDLSSREAMKIELYLSFAKLSVVNFIQSYTVQGKYANVPHTLCTTHGDLTDPYSIIKFIARQTSHIDVSQYKHLYGQNNYQKSLVDQWIQFFTKQLSSLLDILYTVILGKKMVSKKKYHQLNFAIQRSLEVMDEKLKLDNFVCGNFMSLADICLAADLHMGYKLVFNEKYRKSIPYLSKWFENISKTEEFQVVYGLEWVCQKELIPDSFIPEDMDTYEPVIPPREIPHMSSYEDPPVQEDPYGTQAVASRNNLGYNYFKRLLRTTCKDKREKINMMWETITLMNCTFWKIKYNRSVFKQTEQETKLAVDSLIDKCDQYQEFDDYGLTVVRREDGYDTILSVFCFAGIELPDWMREFEKKTEYEIMALDPIKKEADRAFLEEFWTTFNPLIYEDEEDKRSRYYKDSFVYEEVKKKNTNLVWRGNKLKEEEIVRKQGEKKEKYETVTFRLTR